MHLKPFQTEFISLNPPIGLDNLSIIAVWQLKKISGFAKFAYRQIIGSFTLSRCFASLPGQMLRIRQRAV
jgi:hypothetical protein